MTMIMESCKTGCSGRIPKKNVMITMTVMARQKDVKAYRCQNKINAIC